MPNKPKKYSGILAKPIDLRKTPFGTDLNAFVDGEISTRIRALLDHCDIDAALPSEEISSQLVTCH
jgi:hypothetical protein